MDWWVVYRRKPASGSLSDLLEKAGINYFIQTMLVERLNEQGTEMVEVEVSVVQNLVFLQTEEELSSLIQRIDGLCAPMIDSMTGKPAVVSDTDMQKFRLVLSKHNGDVKILRDSYAKFCKNQLVRVKAGDFEGIEGRVVRVLRDRKLVIALGSMAVAISGIDRSLFEPIE